MQSVWILGVLVVIVAFFSVTAGERFFSASNFSLISPEHCRLGCSRGWHDIRHHHLWYRPVGRIGARLFLSGLCTRDAEIGGDGWGTAAIGILAALVTGVLWGL